VRACRLTPASQALPLRTLPTHSFPALWACSLLHATLSTSRLRRLLCSFFPVQAALLPPFMESAVSPPCQQNAGVLESSDGCPGHQVPQLLPLSSRPPRLDSSTNGLSSTSCLGHNQAFLFRGLALPLVDSAVSSTRLRDSYLFRQANPSLGPGLYTNRNVPFFEGGVGGGRGFPSFCGFLVYQDLYTDFRPVPFSMETYNSR